MMRVLRLAIPLAAAALLLATHASASTPSAVDGSLDTSRILLDGDTNASAAFIDAALWSVEGASPLRGSFSLNGTSVVLSRAFVSRVAVGPSNPNVVVWDHETSNGTAQAVYAHFAARGTVSSRYAGILLTRIPGSQATLSTSNAQSFVVGPAPGQTWAAGRTDAATANASFPSRDPMDRFFATTAGEPLAEISTSFVATIHGDFVLALWGPTLVVGDREHGERAYRSGQWDENETAGTRDRYEQLLELRVTNGTLVWHHDEGHANFVASSFTTQTNGAVSFERARGVLQTPTHAYSTEDGAVQLVGVVSQEIRPGPQGGALHSTIHDSRATISGAPATSVPRPTGPLADRTLWVGVGAGLLLALVVVGIWQFPEWKAWLQPLTLDDRKHRADMALIRNENATALAESQKVVQERPDDPDAWYLHATALFRVKGAEAALNEVGPVVDGLREYAPLPLTLAVICLNLGRREDAIQWLVRAECDPNLAVHLRANPGFQALVRTLRFGPRRLKDVSKAYA